MVNKSFVQTQDCEEHIILNVQSQILFIQGSSKTLATTKKILSACLESGLV